LVEIEIIMNKNSGQNSKYFFASLGILLGLFLLAVFPAFGQKSEPVRSVEINKKPLQDLGKLIHEKWSKNELDIAKPFKVKLEVKLLERNVENVKSVSFDLENTKWVELPAEESGDPKMVAVMKDAIMAVGDSGFLSQFYNLGITDFTLVCFQNDEKIVLTAESDQKSSERSKRLAAGLNGLISIGKIVVKGDDEKVLLNGFQKVSDSGNNLIINFELPALVGQEMLKRHLTLNKDKNEQK
jgi:hypothetical protein